MKGPFELLFRKRDRRAGPPTGTHGEGGGVPAQQFYRIDFDMMVKGSIHQRRKGPVRQYGVTVNGSTRLVTSGDMVDGETYKALLAAGAIRPQTPSEANLAGIPPFINDPLADQTEE